MAAQVETGHLCPITMTRASVGALAARSPFPVEVVDPPDERFPPAKFGQLTDKMGPMVQYAIGAFIQSLEQNPGIEAYLQSLGTRCHVYVGTGLGDITVTAEEALRLDRAQHRWNEFWAKPERCEPLREHFNGEEHDPHAPRDPSGLFVGSE